MSGRGLVEVLAPALLEETEFYEFVAHHVGMRRKTLLYSAQCICHYMVPVFFVQRYYFRRQTVFSGYEGAHLDVFLSGAVSLAVVHAYADVKQMQVVSLSEKSVDHYRAVNTSGNQYRYSHTSSSSDSLWLLECMKWSERK